MTTQLIKKEKINWVKDVKFTEKRAPYKKYSKASWNWSEIFCEIEALKESHSKIFKIISEKYNINYGTLKNKYYKFKNNEQCNNIDVENRGTYKIFSDDEEDDIFLFIKENFIDKNRILCNEIIKIYALEKFNLLYSESDKKFTASVGWINTFKKNIN